MAKKSKSSLHSATTDHSHGQAQGRNEEEGLQKIATLIKSKKTDLRFKRNYIFKDDGLKAHGNPSKSSTDKTPSRSSKAVESFVSSAVELIKMTRKHNG